MNPRDSSKAIISAEFASCGILQRFLTVSYEQQLFIPVEVVNDFKGMKQSHPHRTAVEADLHRTSPHNICSPALSLVPRSLWLGPPPRDILNIGPSSSKPIAVSDQAYGLSSVLKIKGIKDQKYKIKRTRGRIIPEVRRLAGQEAWARWIETTTPHLMKHCSFEEEEMDQRILWRHTFPDPIPDGRTGRLKTK
ncbi:unnamed protein product [Nezara viridula]|uniref:Uncharacterized protein n=1 Tax=Nezara viridula TaxID=85310 RepID=A0A9P0E755_NEZVI|nr:unnamed protein product [Nezara viridula]